MLSTAGLELQTSRAVAARYSIAPPPVRCTAGVADSAGARFDCVAIVAGQRLVLAGTVASASGRFSLAPLDAVVYLPALSKVLSQRLTARAGGTVTVSCAGPSRLVVRPGAGLTCAARSAGGTERLSVTVQGVAGEVTYRLSSGGSALG